MVSKLLRAEQVAEILNVSKPFAYALMARGDLPVVRLGRTVRVRENDLEQFIRDRISQQNVSVTLPFLPNILDL